MVVAPMVELSVYMRDDIGEKSSIFKSLYYPLVWVENNEKKIFLE